MKAFFTMLKVDFKLSLRGLDMLIFAICMPIAVALIIGSIYGTKPAFDGANYTFYEQTFSGLISISICASGLMGLPLVIADLREKKILKRYKVTPINPVILLIEQAIIYIIYCLASLIILTLISVIFFDFKLQGSMLKFLASYFFVIISMFSIGLMVGGVAKNSKKAGAIASIIYFPSLIFSGTTLPYDAMPQALQKFSDFLPLTQGVKFLQASVIGNPLENVKISIIALSIIACACLFVAIKFFKWE